MVDKKIDEGIEYSADKIVEGVEYSVQWEDDHQVHERAIEWWDTEVNERVIDWWNSDSDEEEVESTGTSED